jgi:hypothetical protein
MRLLAGVLVVTTGCSAVVDDNPGEDEAAVEATEQAIRAKVSVQRTAAATAADQPAGQLSTHVAARFVRVSGGLDFETAERIIGTGELDAAAPYGCAWRDGTLPFGRGASSHGAIELLEMGDIVLRAGADRLALAPRAFPDVGELVSGVVYTSRDGSADLPDATTYELEVNGPGDEVFTVLAEAPAAPRGLRLGGAALTDGDDLVFAANEALEIAWEPSAAIQGDRIYVTVSDDDDGQAFSCVFPETGSASIPAGLLAFAAGTQLDFIVHRHRRASVELPSLHPDHAGSAIVDFDFAVAFRAVLD